MHQGIYLRYFFFTLVIIISASHLAVGQAIADFDFEDPTDLTKNSVLGGMDAIGINPFARGADGGVYTISDPADQNPADPAHQNIVLEIPLAAVTNQNGGSIYIETDIMWQEESAWLFYGGTNNHSGIFYHKTAGFKVRYYTTSDQNYIGTDWISFNLEEGVKKKVTFYYNETTGLAHLFVDGAEVWKTTDSKDPNGNFYAPTPGEPFYWHTENQIITVGPTMDGNSHKPGQGSIPSLYRFKVYEEPCSNLDSSPPVVAEPDLHVCAGGNVTLEASGADDGAFYFWYASQYDPEAAPLRDEDGNIYNGSSMPVSAESLEAGQTYTYSVVLSNGACASPPEEVRVHVHQTEKPTASIDSPPICGAGKATISLGSDEWNQFFWYTSQDPAELPFTQTGNSYTTDNLSQITTYYVSVMGDYCESARTAVEIFVHPVPAEPKLEQSSFVLCGPGEATLKINNPPATDITYNWYAASNGELMPLHSGPESTFTIDAVSDMLIMVKASTGECESDATEVDIKVNELPFIDAGEDITILKGESIELQAQGRNGETFSCSWYPSESLDRLDIPNPVATPETSTSYIVKRTDSQTGCESIDTLTVFVINKFPVPNAFSPNFDGVNDYWQIPNIDNYPNCVVKVFNNWGNEIFSSKGYNIPWDGTFNGQELPAGGYYYTLHLSPDHEGVRGSVVIMR